MPASKTTIRVSSWNVAAINDNPFEYYVTIDSSANGNTNVKQKNYERTMEEIDEKLINADRHAIKVKDIVSREMLLDARREILKTLDWTESECDLAIEFFTQHFAERKILSDFLLDADIGAKRLCSMPDRLTTKVSSEKCRPCVTTSYSDVAVLSDDSKWWRWSRWFWRV